MRLDDTCYLTSLRSVINAFFSTLAISVLVARRECPRLNHSFDFVFVSVRAQHLCIIGYLVGIDPRGLGFCQLCKLFGLFNTFDIPTGLQQMHMHAVGSAMPQSQGRRI